MPRTYTPDDGYLITFYQRDAETPIGHMKAITLQDLGWPDVLTTDNGVFQRYGFQGLYRYIRVTDFNASGMVTWTT